jgi:hypothetical protein
VTARAQRVSERTGGLRIVYAVVFLGLAASALAAAWPELTQLYVGLGRPYHFGAPPRPLPLLGAGLVLLGLGVVGAAWARGRSAPLWASVVILVAAVLPMFGLWGEVPQGRSWAAADRVILDVGHALQRRMVDVLQQRGEVPLDEATWQVALAEVAGPTPSPARDRSFQRLPWRVQRIPEPTARPDPLVPSTLLVWVASEGEAFQIHPVGFSPGGQVAPLADDQGVPVVLRGTFNPDMREPPRLPALPEVSPRPR